MGSNQDHANGISEYRALLGCIKRYSCEKEQEPDGGEDANFGTLMHGWLAAYHLGVESLPILTDTIPEKGYVAPSVLASRYAARFTRSGLGTPMRLLGKVMVEERLHMQVTLPDGSVEPFSGTVDSATLFDADDCELFERERGVKLLPGRYLNDFKTKAKKDGTLVAKFLADAQFTGYHQLWTANGGEPLDGTLVHVLIRYKDDRDDGFLTILVPPPDDYATLSWMSIIHEGARRRRQLGLNWVDPTHCFDYARVCPCYGNCARHNFPDRM